MAAALTAVPVVMSGEGGPVRVVPVVQAGACFQALVLICAPFGKPFSILLINAFPA